MFYSDLSLRSLTTSNIAWQILAVISLWFHFRVPTEDFLLYTFLKLSIAGVVELRGGSLKCSKQHTWDFGALLLFETLLTQIAFPSLSHMYQICIIVLRLLLLPLYFILYRHIPHLHSPLLKPLDIASLLIVCFLENSN